MKRFRNPQTVDDRRDALTDKDGGVSVSLQDMSTMLDTFESTFALSPMSIVVADARAVDMPIVYVNQSFLDLTGYTKAYTVGRNCRFLQGEATDPDAVARVRTAIKQRQSVMVELLNYKQDGSFFWTSLSLGPVFNSDGELIFYFASQVDVTAQHLADALTAESEKINALGRVTAALAHDLNNLLHVMAGNLDRLRTRAEQEPQMLRHVKAAISASDRAATLTQQLLTFSGSGHIYSETSSLNSLVSSIRLLLSSAAGFDVNVEYDLRDDLPDVYMDDETIRTLLIIYVLAARDHAPKYSTVILHTSMATLEVGSDQQALERAVRLSIVSSVNVREERNDPDKAPAVGPNTLVNVALLKRMGGHLSVTMTDAGQRRVDMYLPCAKPLVAEGMAVHQIGARRRGDWSEPGCWSSMITKMC